MYRKTPGQDFSRRLPPLVEVWKFYKSLGCAPPEQIGEQKLLRIRHLAQTAVELDDRNLIFRNRNELLGMIDYELGQTQHRQHPVAASQSFLNANKKLTVPAFVNDPRSNLERQSLLEIIRLMHARLDPTEQKYQLQRKGAVRSLGRILTSSLNEYGSLISNDRYALYGTMIEAAFLGTLLTMGDTVTFLGAPTTERQDRRANSNGVGYKQAINGVQRASSVDINIYGYSGPFADSTIPAQVKARDKDEHDLYDENILMLYGDRDLFVENLKELGVLSQSLTAYSGEPDRTLEIAGSNIELAIEQHHAT